MKPRSYDDLSKQELIEQLKARDRKDATRFGLVWEADEIERDKALNSDFVALDLDPALSYGDGPWRNLIIEGDNYDALRALKLGFAGRVKCIYIDPPYNTGNKDFIYNDRFVDKEHAWRHSLWCEFMFRRLELAKDLLAPDGVIFVSIDDNEVFHLGMLMNRVFGESNFVANCIWQKRYSRENRESIGDAHEYLITYALSTEAFKKRRGRISLSSDQAAVYKNPNSDPEGRWRGIPMTAQGFRPNQMYAVTSPTGKTFKPPEGRCWSMVESEFKKRIAANRVYWGKDGSSQPSIIRYLSEVDGLVPWTWWPHEEVGHTDEARKEIRALFGTQTAFDTPKPVRLLERILQIGSGPNDIILDFFAGSGTTAHAVAKLNASDGGNRRFILVSSTEATLEEPDKNICRDVCAERVRRVMTGYGETAGVGGNFAYLRCRRIAESELIDIAHEQVWTALQLLHRENLQPYTANALHWRADESEGEGLGALAYVERLGVGTMAELKRLIRSVPSALIYTWQAAALRSRLAPFEHVQIESIPQSLARKFGFKVS